MNQGAVQQSARRSEVYRPSGEPVRRPTSSAAPSMNLLAVEGAVDARRRPAALDGAEIVVPRCARRRRPKLLLGVRPEHVAIRRRWRRCAARCSAPNISARTQMLTSRRRSGTIKARLGKTRQVEPAIAGRACRSARERLAVRQERARRALRSALHEGARTWLTSSLHRRHQALRRRSTAVDGPVARRRRWRVRRPARPERRGQDDDAAADRRPRSARRRRRC